MDETFDARRQEARETIDIARRAHPANNPDSETIAELHEVHAAHERKHERPERAQEAERRAKRVRKSG